MEKGLPLSIVAESAASAETARGFASRVRQFADELLHCGPEHEMFAMAEGELRLQVDELEGALERFDADREWLRSLFDASSDALLVADAAGDVRDANTRATQLLGLARTELVGHPLSRWLGDVTVPSAVEIELAPAKLVRASCTKVDRWTLVVMTALPPRSLEAQLERTREQLARERTSRIALEEENRARDRFLAVLSHDLRGPIHAVLGWTQMLMTGTLSGQTAEKALATILRSARAQLGLVEDLLDLSAIASGNVTLHRSLVDVAELAVRAVESFGPAAESRSIALVLEGDVPPAEGAVLGDAGRLGQVLTNLLANALKFTEPGGSVRVSVQRDEHAVEVRVQDSGRGISADVLPFVFEPFWQARPNDGVGLGLAIVKRLAELHGGSIEATSEGDGRGATFVLRVPATRMARPDAGEPAAAEPVRLDGTRVLVVEDDEDAAELLSEVLRHCGATVVVAHDVDEALAIHLAAASDVVVSDIGLPGEDGFALMRKLRALDARVPAIALTGFATDADVSRAFAAGFDVHLSKPAPPERLIHAIRELAPKR